jgi:hypothetical protein
MRDGPILQQRASDTDWLRSAWRLGVAIVLLLMLDSLISDAGIWTFRHVRPSGRLLFFFSLGWQGVEWPLLAFWLTWGLGSFVWRLVLTVVAIAMMSAVHQLWPPYEEEIVFHLVGYVAFSNTVVLGLHALMLPMRLHFVATRRAVAREIGFKAVAVVDTAIAELDHLLGDAFGNGTTGKPNVGRYGVRLQGLADADVGGGDCFSRGGRDRDCPAVGAARLPVSIGNDCRDAFGLVWTALGICGAVYLSRTNVGLPLLDRRTDRCNGGQHAAFALVRDAMETSTNHHADMDGISERTNSRRGARRFVRLFEEG